MAKVSVTINGVQGEVEQGKTLLQAAKEIGAGVMHACFGNGLCSTCRVKVVSGAESLSAQEQFEKVSLNYHLSFDDETRLCCQTKLTGDKPVVVAAPKPFRWLAPPNKKK